MADETKTPLTVKVDGKMMERIDALCEVMKERAGGISISRHALVQRALTRGVEALEGEVGTSPPKSKRK